MTGIEVSAGSSALGPRGARRSSLTRSLSLLVLDFSQLKATRIARNMGSIWTRCLARIPRLRMALKAMMKPPV
jgi:hypothetical protein